MSSTRAGALAQNPCHSRGSAGQSGQSRRGHRGAPETSQALEARRRGGIHSHQVRKKEESVLASVCVHPWSGHLKFKMKKP